MIKKIFAFIKEKEEALIQLIKHYFIGGIGFVLNWLFFNTCLWLGMKDTIIFGIAFNKITLANIPTYTLTLIISFLLQKYFTYKANKNMFPQLVKFTILTVCYMLVDNQLLKLLIDHMGLAASISKFMTLMVLSPLSFLIQKFIVFRQPKEVQSSTLND